MSCENACFAILQRLCIHKPIGRVNTAATVNPTSGHNFGTGTMAGIQAECKGRSTSKLDRDRVLSTVVSYSVICLSYSVYSTFFPLVLSPLTPSSTFASTTFLPLLAIEDVSSPRNTRVTATHC